jgi:hypothetical protein
LQDIEPNTVLAFYNGSRARPETFDPSTWETNNYRIFDPADMPHGTIDIPVWAQVQSVLKLSIPSFHKKFSLLTVSLLLQSTYLEYPSVCPLVGIGPPPSPPLPLASVSPPHGTKWGGGGTHSHTGEGVGESQFGRLEKKPSTLSTL